VKLSTPFSLVHRLKVKNERSYTSTPPVLLYGVKGEKISSSIVYRDLLRLLELEVTLQDIHPYMERNSYPGPQCLSDRREYRRPSN
jgi:hypothetical protein